MYAKGGTVYASSRDVAAFFGKQHAHVLRAIDALIAEAPATFSNFGEGPYTLPSTGAQRHRYYEMTRDGFTLLAMGFTGKTALVFKVRYIEVAGGADAAFGSTQEDHCYRWATTWVEMIGWFYQGSHPQGPTGDVSEHHQDRLE